MRTGTFNGFQVELRDPGIAWIQFNSPERLNCITSATKRDLIEAVTQAQMDDEVRVVVFTGTGKAFCAGDDLRSFVPDDHELASESNDFGGERLVGDISQGHQSELGTYNGLRVHSQALNTAVRNLDKLTICALNGTAIQTGFSLALSCDFRVAADTAKMGSATLRFAMLPDEGGHYLLVQAMGLAKAMDFLMRKRIVTANEALELGLVHEVVPAADMETHAMELATELAEGPQVAMRLLKRAMYNAAELSWSQSLEDIASKTAVSDHHPDAHEGGYSFLEKRAPVFNRWLDKTK